MIQTNFAGFISITRINRENCGEFWMQKENSELDQMQDAYKAAVEE